MSILNKILFLSLSRSHRDKKLNKIKNTIKNLCNIFLILISTLLLKSCNTTEPPGNQTLTLKLEDVSCTEAWIQLTTNNLQLPTTINILKNNTVAQTFSLSTQDTLLYIDSLLPNQTYKFKVVLTNNQQPTSYPQPPTSNEVSVTTMDTTSHEFSWQSWEFGECGSSSLYDVAIIDENNIWAVGEIYMRDSLGNCDPNAYNAVHWDGQKWELKRVYYKGGFWPIRTIFAFNANDIWFSGYMRYFNGQIIELEIPDILIGWGINKLWGSSSSDLYAVGNNGNIAHWDGVKWRKIESGTNANIVDISGIQNSEGKHNKYCAADNLLIKIDGDNYLTSLPVEHRMFLNSVWVASNRLIYTAGNGIVLYKNESWLEIETPNINTIYSIKGQSYNDIVGLSANHAIFHFNGYSWNSIQTGINNIYLKIQNKKNVIATVGWQNDRAIITLLFRN